MPTARTWTGSLVSMEALLPTPPAIALSLIPLAKASSPSSRAPTAFWLRSCPEPGFDVSDGQHVARVHGGAVRELYDLVRRAVSRVDLPLSGIELVEFAPCATV